MARASALLFLAVALVAAALGRAFVVPAPLPSASMQPQQQRRGTLLEGRCVGMWGYGLAWVGVLGGRRGDGGGGSSATVVESGVQEAPILTRTHIPPLSHPYPTTTTKTKQARCR